MRLRPLAAKLVALAVLAPLAACSTVAEAVKGPDLAPVGYPASLAPINQPMVSSREPSPQPASANSLWRTGARAFFNDQRASRIGDILTVNIDIDDSAKTNNATSSSRTAGVNAGVPHFLGLESTLGKILPGAYDAENMIETKSATNNAGTG
jgi:flagellar L-ring protein precursor FlgH